MNTNAQRKIDTRLASNTVRNVELGGEGWTPVASFVEVRKHGEAGLELQLTTPGGNGVILNRDIHAFAKFLSEWASRIEHRAKELREAEAAKRERHSLGESSVATKP